MYLLHLSQLQNSVAKLCYGHSLLLSGSLLSPMLAPLSLPLSQIPLNKAK